jgi:hypothetical protein
MVIPPCFPQEEKEEDRGGEDANGLFQTISKRFRPFRSVSKYSMPDWEEGCGLWALLRYKHTRNADRNKKCNTVSIPQIHPWSYPCTPEEQWYINIIDFSTNYIQSRSVIKKTVLTKYRL